MKTQANTLSDYLRKTGTTQAAIGSILGVTQGAIHRMCQSKRDVRIVVMCDGQVGMFEIKPIGNTSFKSNQFSLKYDGKVSIEHEQ